MPARLLRTLSTVLFGFAVAQAGFGSGYIGGNAGLLVIHYVNAFLVVGLVVACVVAGMLYRRAGGPSWPLVFPLVLLAVAVVQIILGRSGTTGAHVFLGVLYLSGVTTYCSYLWRHQPAADLPVTA